MPTDAGRSGWLPPQLEKTVTTWLPFVGVALVYLATQFAAKLKVCAPCA